MLRRKKGFTLVELLIVIAIIVVIAGIGVPVVMGMIENSNRSADEAQADLITDTLENWVEDYQQYKLKVDDSSISIEDVKAERTETIIRQGCSDYFKDIKNITLWDLEEFEDACLTTTGYPKDAEMLRLVLRYYIKDNALEVKSGDSAFYYIPYKGTVVVNKAGVGAATIKNQLPDYELTEKDEIYRLAVTGDIALSLKSKE